MDTAPISGLVPMIHVADVERSAAFYRYLGFEIGNSVPRGGNRMEWAWHLFAHGISASEITFPDYLPNGECRVVDPDGYVLMVAQAAAETP